MEEHILLNGTHDDPSTVVSYQTAKTKTWCQIGGFKIEHRNGIRLKNKSQKFLKTYLH